MKAVLINMIIHNHYTKELTKSVTVNMKIKLILVTWGMGEMSRTFSYNTIGTFAGSQEMFCTVCGPQWRCGDCGCVSEVV
jgi:hypothetical protein